MPTSRPLVIPTAAQTIAGRDVTVGMVVRNTKSKSKQVFMVIGGAEFSSFGLARLLTNLPAGNQAAQAPSDQRSWHQTLALWNPETGSRLSEPGNMAPIHLDGTYELINNFSSFQQG